MRARSGTAARPTLFSLLTPLKPANDILAESGSPDHPGVAHPRPAWTGDGGGRPECSPFLVWQLADSSLPTGGFAHSAGLEAACQCGEIQNRRDLEDWLRAGVGQLTYSALPFVNATYSAPELLADTDRFCEAFTSNHVANRASRAQGKALLSIAERAFFCSTAPARPPTTTPFGHHAPVFGFVASRLGLDATTARRLFAFQHLRGSFAAAVRLNLVGPNEAQSMLFLLGAEAGKAADLAEGLGLGDVAQTAPILDLLQGCQDRLYSRLFQS